MQLQGSWSARIWRAAMAGVLALAAVGCSDTDDGGPEGTAGTATLAGTAAVGAPIVGGAITAKCSGGQTFAATSNATGGYSIALPSSALPCALQVSGGTVGGAANTQSFHSFATRSGTVNLTPLTDLAVALASGSNPLTWFNAVSAANPPDLDELAPSISTLLQKLRGAGYNVPANLNPVTTAFTPAAGNLYDDLLEALAARLRSAETSYAELLVQVVEEGDDFEPPPAEDEEEPGPGGNTSPATINDALPGSYTLVYTQQAAGAPFADKAEVPVVVGVNNTLVIDGKTLSNPYTRNGNLAEIIWADTAKKLEYALIDNVDGDLKEINVGDSSQRDAQGNPRYLGQLKKKVPVANVPQELKAIGGTYAYTVKSRTGGFTNTNTVGGSVTVLIDSTTGVIDIDGSRFKIDPAAQGFYFEKQLGQNPPRYLVLGKHTDGDGLNLEIYISEGNVTGFQLRRNRDNGNGTSNSSELVLEKPQP
ncbi:hypothetical protein [Solimonas sp. SE-A11]|uniref:hypothetical protein n=1 Tax=Solimonas sp. SE-A11 TaxID=3054954 RepID=UPI00259CE043|nr:hypothetical protein [Solimonas sp. SE-A11]MDM4772474.1 hypothetical protein [Solimonas sp. SE-A11]